MNFNPRTPCGVRLNAPAAGWGYYSISIHAPLAGCDAANYELRHIAAEFQSTHPLRGATQRRALYLIFAVISIHAPLAGCDYRGERPLLWIEKFQSTHPLRGATTVCRSLSRLASFQSTHPLRGATAGDDARPGTVDFNPRTPCGVRPVLLSSFGIPPSFQSTHPLRGATPRPPGNRRAERRFQSTHPLRGATGLRLGARKGFEFQSTHPLRGATTAN